LSARLSAVDIQVRRTDRQRVAHQGPLAAAGRLQHR
jgi:hypothetical protein